MQSQHIFKDLLEAQKKSKRKGGADKDKKMGAKEIKPKRNLVKNRQQRRKELKKQQKKDKKATIKA